MCAILYSHISCFVYTRMECLANGNISIINWFEIIFSSSFTITSCILQIPPISNPLIVHTFHNPCLNVHSVWFLDGD